MFSFWNDFRLACFYEGRLIEHGDGFRQNECTTCRCDRGSVVCRDEQCPAVNCVKPVRQPGQCCPICDSGLYMIILFLSSFVYISVIMLGIKISYHDFESSALLH